MTSAGVRCPAGRYRARFTRYGHSSPPWQGLVIRWRKGISHESENPRTSVSLLPSPIRGPVRIDRVTLVGN